MDADPRARLVARKAVTLARKWQREPRRVRVRRGSTGEPLDRDAIEVASGGKVRFGSAKYTEAKEEFVRLLRNGGGR